MKRFSLLLLLALAGVASCKKTEEPDVIPDVSFQAALPAGVKTAWKSGDKVSVISIKGGQVATVDCFTTQDKGSKATFSGQYTGAEGAALLVVYPALDNASGNVYESASLFGNSGGFFRAVKNTGYLIYAPKADMKILQEKNADKSHLEDMEFMIAGGKTTAIFDGSISLSTKMSMIKLTMDSSALTGTEKVTSVSLTLDEGTPFTPYRGTFSLDASKKQWSCTEPKASCKLDLGSFAPGATLTAYIPVFPNSTGASLAGTKARELQVEVKTTENIYGFISNIPASNGSYSLDGGKEVDLSGKLALKQAGPPVEGPVIGTVKKIMDKGPATVYVDGDVLYVGSSGFIYTFDISKDPMNPTQIGSVAFPGAARQITCYNGRVVISARATGVWVFDAKDPKNLKLVSRYDGVELSTGIDIAGDCVVVGERQTGVEFVDARNPEHLEHIEIIKTPESQTVFYAGGYLYSGEWGAGQVSIFNAQDLNNIRLVKTINLWGNGDGVWVTGNRLYASTGHNAKNDSPRLNDGVAPYSEEGDGKGHAVEIWDVSNPEDPHRISTCSFDLYYKSGTDCWLNRPSGDCKTLYCGDVHNGLYVVDISKETEPKIIGHWEAAAHQSSAVTSVALGNGVCYVTVSGMGLYAIESSRANPSKRDRGTLPRNLDARHVYETPSTSKFNAWVPDHRGQVKGAVPYGDALFVGAGAGGLYTVKKNAQGKPYTFARLDIPFAGGVAIKGNLLFVAREHTGLGVYRINPSTLALTEVTILKSQLTTSVKNQYSYWVTVPNDKYVINSNHDNYQFLTIGGTESNPTFTAVKIGGKESYSQNVTYNRYISEKTSTNGMLSYATRSGLFWINLSSTSSIPTPVLSANVAKNALTEGSTLYKNDQFLICRSNVLKIVEPGGDDVIQVSNQVDGFSGIPRWESGDNVLISNFVGRFISKINTANFANCQLLFKESTIGYPEPGLFWNGKCVVPCGYQGLLIEK